MARQSISLSKPNNEWLKEQVGKEEYSSKSELVNDLIRHARKEQEEIEWIRAKLERAEERTRTEGYSNKSPEQILTQIKEKTRRNGDL